MGLLNVQYAQRLRTAEVAGNGTGEAVVAEISDVVARKEDVIVVVCWRRK